MKGNPHLGEHKPSQPDTSSTFSFPNAASNRNQAARSHSISEISHPPPPTTSFATFHNRIYFDPPNREQGISQPTPRSNVRSSSFSMQSELHPKTAGLSSRQAHRRPRPQSEQFRHSFGQDCSIHKAAADAAMMSHGEISGRRMLYDSFPKKFLQAISSLFLSMAEN